MKSSNAKQTHLEIVLCVLLLASLAIGIGEATDVKPWMSAQAVTVNNSTATTITTGGLANTTTVQMFIRGSSTAQIFTLTLPDATTIEVPSGGTLTLRVGTNLAGGSTIGTVLTGTGSAVLQVISLREFKQ